jgi:hypothetical protein
MTLLLACSAEMALVSYLLGSSCTTNYQGSLATYQTFEAINSDTLAIMQQIRASTATGAIATAIGVERSPLGILNLSAATIPYSEDRIIFALNGSHSSIPQYMSGNTVYDFMIPTPNNDHNPRLIVPNSADHSRRSRAVLTGAATPFASSGIDKCISQIGGIGSIFLLLARTKVCWLVGWLVVLATNL